MLNVFSYTCTAGIRAATGGAASVTNVDFSPSALALGRTNAELNGLKFSEAVDGKQARLKTYTRVRARTRAHSTRAHTPTCGVRT